MVVLHVGIFIDRAETDGPTQNANSSMSAGGYNIALLVIKLGSKTYSEYTESSEGEEDQIEDVVF